MKQDRFQWLVAIVLLLIVVGFGFIVSRQQQLIRELSKSSPQSIPEVGAMMERRPAPPLAPQVASGQGIAQVNVGTETPEQPLLGIEFIHRCVNGQVSTQRSEWSGQMHTFCVGKNQLFVREEGKETLLDERMVGEAKDAPILLQANVVSVGPAQRSTKILVSYAPEVCTTTKDCGVGMPTNLVSHLYVRGSGALRQLSNFPKQAYGLGVWNTSFTKALFYPKTCGGAGCVTEALYGYNLERDQFVEGLTRDKAAEAGEESPDSAGKPLPMWDRIEWTSDTDFRARIMDPSGAYRTVTGRF